MSQPRKRERAHVVMPADCVTAVYLLRVQKWKNADVCEELWTDSTTFKIA